MYDFISAWRTHVTAENAADVAYDAVDAARQAGREIRMLRAQIDRLEMACVAMWTIVKERLKCGDEDLARLVRDIDLRDGKVDGRSKPNSPPCRRCGRGTSVRTGVCLYCGNPPPQDDLDDDR
jgi:hypothetical protein